MALLSPTTHKIIKPQINTIVDREVLTEMEEHKMVRQDHKIVEEVRTDREVLNTDLQVRNQQDNLLSIMLKLRKQQSFNQSLE
jgi:hypothetical protein